MNSSNFAVDRDTTYTGGWISQATRKRAALSTQLAGSVRFKG